MIVPRLALLLALSVAAPLAQATTTPAPRLHHGLAYWDARLERVVLVGEASSPRDGVRDRVWSWSGARWEPVTDSGPVGRVNAAAAWDPTRGVAVVNGGARRAADDTTRWAIVGDGWEGERAAAWRAGPDIDARDHHAMAEDGRGGVVLFGGIGANRGVPWPDDTWRLRDGRWTRVASGGPVGRGRNAMTYDPRRRQVVMFGGASAPDSTGAQAFMGDTWTWDGERWHLAATTGPRGRYAHAMVYDEREGVVLLYGGAGAHRNAPLTDMWKWDGTRWTEVPLAGPTPGFRYQPLMVYDRKRGRTVLYGGLQGPDTTTWEWDGARWHAVGP